MTGETIIESAADSARSQPRPGDRGELWAQIGEDGRRLILVAGLARSGTTWLGKIFDSHPETLYRHEPEPVCPNTDIPFLVRSSDHERLRPALDPYVHDLLDTRTVKTSGALPQFKKSYRGPVAEALRRSLIMVTKLFSPRLRHMPISDMVRRSRRARIRLVWKSIDSVGRVGFFAENLPASRILHLVRHPCGQIASTLRGQRMGKFISDGDPGIDLPFLRLLCECRPARSRGIRFEDLENLSRIERWAWYWVLVNEKAMLELDGCEQGRTVAYEDLCADPLGVSRRIFDFAGLEWSGQTEEFVGQSVSRDSSRFYSVFKDPKKAANRWREEMTPDDVRAVSRIAAESRPGRLFDWD